MLVLGQEQKPGRGVGNARPVESSVMKLFRYACDANALAMCANLYPGRHNGKWRYPASQYLEHRPLGK